MDFNNTDAYLLTRYEGYCRVCVLNVGLETTSNKEVIERRVSEHNSSEYHLSRVRYLLGQA